MEKEIAHVNAGRVQQANNTPLREEPLQSLLGEQMDFDKWESILAGLVLLPLDGIEEGTQLWYEYITSAGAPESLKIHWTPQDYFASWGKMNENTGSAPGIHFGHMKCTDKGSKAAVFFLLALLTLQTGYAQDQWRTGIVSLIPKKLFDLQPQKLCLILLMDARFNHNNKLIEKVMMKYGEKHSLLAEEQYGSRKNKAAVLHATNKRLVLDVL